MREDNGSLGWTWKEKRIRRLQKREHDGRSISDHTERGLRASKGSRMISRGSLPCFGSEPGLAGVE
jgi:hypothetical protein